MKIYDYYITPSIDINQYFTDENICFLDIETTGLSRKYSQVYLIGFVYFNSDKNSWSLKQVFIDHIDKEKQLLHYTNRFIQKFDLLITYNGESFDLPFIQKRSSINKLQSKILDIKSFDIYRKIRREKAYLDLNNLKLKTIEESLDIYREDEYSGKDCIAFYYQYMENGDNDLKDKILKHNYDDLYYLLDVMKIFDSIREKKSIITRFNNSDIKIEIKNILVSEDILMISCNTSRINDGINYIYYEEGFSIDWKIGEKLLIELEVKEGFVTPTEKAVFIDTRNLPFRRSLKDSTSFTLPNNIILLKIKNEYLLDNIKSTIHSLIKYISPE